MTNVTQATARKGIRKTMADKQINEVAQTLVKSFQETNQAVMENIIAAQERNMRLAQNFFTEGMEVLKANQAVVESIIAAQERNMRLAQGFFTDGTDAVKGQTEATRTLMQELGQKVQEQQAVFQQLARESMDAYMGFLQGPLSYYQQALKTANTVTGQGLGNVQKATQQAQDITQSATQQGLENVQETTQQAQDKVQATTQQGLDNIQEATHEGQDVTQQGLENVQETT